MTANSTRSLRPRPLAPSGSLRRRQKSVVLRALSNLNPITLAKLDKVRRFQRNSRDSVGEKTVKSFNFP